MLDQIYFYPSISARVRHAAICLYLHQKKEKRTRIVDSKWNSTIDYLDKYKPDWRRIYLVERDIKEGSILCLFLFLNYVELSLDLDLLEIYWEYSQIIESLRNSHWEKGKHYGDCFNHSVTCHRCLVEALVADAKLQICLWFKFTNL